MPTARETLLEAAHEAVSARPWTGIRMVDIASCAGVSRQTLYNEFGSKEGLGAALVTQRVEGFLAGAAAAAAQAGRRGADPAAAQQAALTGCWGSRMPLSPGALPGAPGDLAAELRDRTVACVAANGVSARNLTELSRACETGLRLALSYVVAPEPEEEARNRVDEVVRALLG